MASSAVGRLLSTAAFSGVQHFSYSVAPARLSSQQRIFYQLRQYHASNRISSRHAKSAAPAPTEDSDNAKLIAVVDELLSEDYRGDHTSQHIINEFKRVLNESNDVTRDVLQDCFRRMVLFIESHHSGSKNEAVLLCYRFFEILKQKISELNAIHSNNSEILDPQMYATMFDIYSRNGFPEQVYELFGEITRLYFQELKRQQQSHNKPAAPQQHEEDDDRSDKELMSDPDSIAAAVAEVERAGSARAEPQPLLAEEDEPSGPKEIFLPVFKDASTYVHLIEACGAVSRPEDVDDIVSFMQRNDVTLTRDVFHAALRAFTPRGLAQQALKYYSDFTSMGIRPTSKTLALLLQVFASARDVRYSAIFEGMQRAGHVEPDTEALRSLLKCMCLISKDYNGAIAIYDRIRSHRDVSVEDYLLLLSCCRETGQDADLAMQLFDRMRYEDGIAPTQAVCAALLRCYSQQDEAATFRLFEDLRAQVPSMEKPDVQAFNALIEASIVAGNIDRARLVLRDMRAEGITPDVISHNLFFQTLYSNQWKPFLERIRNRKKRSLFTEIAQKIQHTVKIVEERRQQEEDLSSSDRKKRGKHEMVDTYEDDSVDEDEESLDQLLDMLKSDNKKQLPSSEKQAVSTSLPFGEAEQEAGKVEEVGFLDAETQALMAEIDKLFSDTSAKKI